MEMMISVVLILLISLFLTQGITTLQRSNLSLKAHDNVEHNRSKLFNLLYYDIVMATSLDILPTKDRRFHIVQMQSNHSLYNIPYAYITYYVHTRTKELIRLEAAHPITFPIAYEQKYSYKANVVAKEVSDFNLYPSIGTLTKQQHKKGKKETKKASSEVNATSMPRGYYLLYLSAKGLNTPLMFEMVKP